MKLRLLCLGLVAATFQLFATGCHPVARWRANHPCGACNDCHPRLERIQSRRVVLGEAVGPTVGPVVGGAPCCERAAPGVPVSFGPAPGDVVPVTHPPAGYPNIGYPMPIFPSPTVVPTYELPQPMPVPKISRGN